MTNKEKKDWLSVQYPLTVICDRYDGTYSGAKWLAFPLHYFYIPSGIRADDPACANFWKDYKEPVGKGAYANDAVKDLIEQMREFEPEESEDERVRKWIYTIVEFLGCPSDDEAARELEEMQPLALAWLEKQQNKARLITANLLEDGIIGVQRELIEFLANNIDAAWVEVIKSADAYAQRIRSMVEKQKEKPAEYLDKNKVYAIMTKLTNLSYSQLIPINSDEFKKLHEITCDVRSLLDYPIEQKSSWSEEDELMILTVIQTLETLGGRGTTGMQIDWLKSLRPSWKPSEGQMEALLWCTAHLGGADHRVLAELYEHLKKL